MFQTLSRQLNGEASHLPWTVSWIVGKPLARIGIQLSHGHKNLSLHLNFNFILFLYFLRRGFPFSLACVVQMVQI